MSRTSLQKLSSVNDRYSMGSANRNPSIHGCTMCSTRSINFHNTPNTLRHFSVAPLPHQSLRLRRTAISKIYESWHTIISLENYWKKLRIIFLAYLFFVAWKIILKKKSKWNLIRYYVYYYYCNCIKLTLFAVFMQFKLL